MSVTSLITYVKLKNFFGMTKKNVKLNNKI